MKIAIVGAGGVGSYIGAKLVYEKKADVSIIARGKHLEAIKKNGLHVKDENLDFVVDKSYFDLAPANGDIFDVIIFTTKAYDLKNAVLEMKPYADKNTLLFALCNGVGHDEVIKSIFPDNPVASACIYIFSNITKPGYVRKYGGVFLLIAGANPMPQTLIFLSELFNDAKMRFKVSENITFECWKKYIFISVFGALTAYYNEPIGAIVKNHYDEAKAMLLEIQAVANKKGIDIPDSIIQNYLIQAQEKIPYNSTTSLQLDINSNRKNELNSLVGTVVQEADKLGVQATTFSKIYNGLKKKISNSI
jgi:2-dehydropantoate 2-reductase